MVGKINGRKIHQEHFPSVPGKFLNWNWCSLEKYKGKKKTPLYANLSFAAFSTVWVHIKVVLIFYHCYFSPGFCSGLTLGLIYCHLILTLLEVCHLLSSRILYAYFHLPYAGSIYSACWLIIQSLMYVRLFFSISLISLSQSSGSTWLCNVSLLRVSLTAFPEPSDGCGLELQCPYLIYSW